MLLFPGLFKKLQDAEYENPLTRGRAPEFTRLKSNSSFRLFGVGLLVVAGIIAYYGYTMR